ncbi:hypothetical protein [Chryseobacterium sp.]|uniref:hypothetical protein n=1 Tax=Chryseobacterium sp. TaxID=1871047 RepID=UPI00261D04DD|nr:hypothetical protein [Chryseobacterium sp.]
MKTLIRMLSNLFCRPKKEGSIAEEPLKEYKGKIKIDKYVDMGNKKIYNATKYLFKTPPEVLAFLNNNTLFWVDEKNGMLGFSTYNRTLLVPLHEVKGIEIQNMLPGKGPGDASFFICLPNNKILMLSISPVIRDFDKYAERITEMMGFEVTFSPEFYNC